MKSWLRISQSPVEVPFAHPFVHSNLETKTKSKPLKLTLRLSSWPLDPLAPGPDHRLTLGLTLKTAWVVPLIGRQMDRWENGNSSHSTRLYV